MAVQKYSMRELRAARVTGTPVAGYHYQQHPASGSRRGDSTTRISGRMYTVGVVVYKQGPQTPGYLSGNGERQDGEHHNERVEENGC